MPLMFFEGRPNEPNGSVLFFLECAKWIATSFTLCRNLSAVCLQQFGSRSSVAEVQGVELKTESLPC